MNLLVITDPRGSEEHHLVAGIDQAAQRFIDQLLGAGSRDDFLRPVLQVEMALVIGGDGLFQFRNTSGDRVVSLPVLSCLKA